MRALVKTEREKEDDELKDGDNKRSGFQANTPFRLRLRVVVRAARAELKDSG
jgi:hypothetical protein